LSGISDDISDRLRLGHEDDMAALHFTGLGADPAGGTAQQLGVDCTVFGRHDIPTRLRFPRGNRDLSLQRRHRDRNLRIPQEGRVPIARIGGEPGLELVAIQKR
jgi:hypothetical protein